jgi:ATP-binding cassette subfamily B protein
MFSRLRHLRGRIAFGIVCELFAGVALSAAPLFMRMLIDQALPLYQVSAVVGAVGAIGLCYLAAAVLESSGLLVSFSVSRHCALDLRLVLLKQMNRLSADYHERTPTGEKLTHLGYDVDEIANLGADITIQSVRVALFFALNLAMMARLNLSMTCNVLPLVPLFAYIQWRFNIVLKRRAEIARHELGCATSATSEHLESVPQIQFLGAEETMTQKVIDVWDGALRALWRQQEMQIGSVLSSMVVVAGAIIFVLLLGSSRVLTHALTIGSLVAFYAYVAQIFGPVSRAMDLYTRLQSTGASIRRVREFLELEPSVCNKGTRSVRSDNLNLGFEIEDISFSYHDQRVFELLTVQIAAGERVALIGAVPGRVR